VAQPRILVIEDDPEITDLFRAMLEDEGYEVLATGDAVDPVVISDLHPALIVLDLRLSGHANGWTWLEKLRQSPDMHAIPVIVCTADARLAQCHADQPHALATDVVLKPFDLDDFTRRVAAACGHGDG
jgi:CheY-like chemotaxis protein